MDEGGACACLQIWCDQKNFGAGGCGLKCGGQRGFCNSCFSESFNEDGFDKKPKKKSKRARQAEGDVVKSQPAPMTEMAPKESKVESQAAAPASS